MHTSKLNIKKAVNETKPNSFLIYTQYSYVIIFEHFARQNDL